MFAIVTRSKPGLIDRLIEVRGTPNRMPARSFVYTNGLLLHTCWPNTRWRWRRGRIAQETPIGASEYRLRAPSRLQKPAQRSYATSNSGAAHLLGRASSVKRDEPFRFPHPSPRRWPHDAPGKRSRRQARNERGRAGATRRHRGPRTRECARASGRAVKRAASVPRLSALERRLEEGYGRRNRETVRDGTG